MVSVQKYGTVLAEPAEAVFEIVSEVLKVISAHLIDDDDDDQARLRNGETARGRPYGQRNPARSEILVRSNHQHPKIFPELKGDSNPPA